VSTICGAYTGRAACKLHVTNVNGTKHESYELTSCRSSSWKLGPNTATHCQQQQQPTMTGRSAAPGHCIVILNEVGAMDLFNSIQ
jgi:hypothetical protein